MYQRGSTHVVSANAFEQVFVKGLDIFLCSLGMLCPSCYRRFLQRRWTSDRHCWPPFRLVTSLSKHRAHTAWRQICRSSGQVSNICIFVPSTIKSKINEFRDILDALHRRGFRTDLGILDTGVILSVFTKVGGYYIGILYSLPWWYLTYSCLGRRCS